MRARWLSCTVQGYHPNAGLKLEESVTVLTLALGSIATRMLLSVATTFLTLVTAASVARPQSPATSAARLSAQTDSVDWFEVDRAVLEQLMAEDLGTVLRTMSETPAPTDARGLMRRLGIFVRAGHRQDAAQAMDRLVASPPASAQPLSHLADFLIGREEWELARAFLERFPRAEPGWGYVFIRQWAASGDPREIDRWLAARAAESPRYWFDERLRFRVDHGTHGELFDALAAAVRAHPSDVTRLTRYVEAVRSFDNGIQLDWIGDVARPALAYDSYTLGRTILGTRVSARAAVALLERSLPLPYAARDQQAIEESRRLTSAFVAPLRDWERDFRLTTRIALADAYMASGQPSKAQPLVEQISAATKDGLPQLWLSQFAGQVQRESGARVIEQRLTRAESENADSSGYWLTRAGYYAGRRERAQALFAYERALALVPLSPNDSVTTQFARYRVVSELVRFLGAPNDTGGRSPAMTVLRRELDATAPGSRYAGWIVRDTVERSTDNQPLLALLRDAVSAEARFWDYLAARGQWNPADEKLLRRMTEHLGPSERERRVARASELASGAHPTRAQALASVLLRYREGARGVSLIRRAIERLPAGHDKDLAVLSLLSAYLYHTNDWRAAEEIFPSARRLLTPAETAEKLGIMAVMAARAGSPDQALRLWKGQSERRSCRSARAAGARRHRREGWPRQALRAGAAERSGELGYRMRR